MPLNPNEAKEILKKSQTKLTGLATLEQIGFINRVTDTLYEIDKFSAAPTPPPTLPTALEREVNTVKDDIDRALRDKEYMNSRTSLISDIHKEGTSHFEAFQIESYRILRKKIQDMQVEAKRLLYPPSSGFSIPDTVVHALDLNHPSVPIPKQHLREYKLLGAFLRSSASLRSLDTLLFDPSKNILAIQKSVKEMQKMVYDAGTIFNNDSMHYYDPAIFPISPGRTPPDPTFQNGKIAFQRHIDNINTLLTDKEHEIQSKSFLPYARSKNYGKKAWRTGKPKVAKAGKWVGRQTWSATKAVTKFGWNTTKTLANAGWKTLTFPVWGPWKGLKKLGKWMKE